MQKSFLLGLALVFLLSAAAFGQGPFLMPQIKPEWIVLDGKGNDWEAFYPEEFILTPELLIDTAGGEMPSPDDFDCALYLGYTVPPDNMFYVYASVTDDLWNSDEADNGNSYKDDCMEIEWDADNSGGNYRETDPQCIEGQQYGVHMREGMAPGDYVYSQSGLSPTWLWGPDDLQWSAQPPYMEFQWTAPVGTENVTYAYEVKMAAWDMLATDAASAVRHVFAEDQTVGLNVNFDEVDAVPDTRDNQIGQYGDAWTDADLMADFITVGLVEGPSVAVESSSWGEVKASLR